MSKYSGKCDFYDVIKIWGEDKILHSRIMLDNNKQFEPKTIEDLKPYFGHLIGSMGMSHEKDEDGYYGTINLCSRPYTEELKDRLRDIYIDENKWKERCKTIDEAYGVYQKELFHPYTAVSYEDEEGVTHIIPFEGKVEAKIFYSKLKKGKNIHIIDVDLLFQDRYNLKDHRFRSFLYLLPIFQQH